MKRIFLYVLFVFVCMGVIEIIPIRAEEPLTTIMTTEEPLATTTTEPSTTTMTSTTTTTAPQRYYDWISAGIVQLNQNDLGGAMQNFQHALEENPQGVAALYYIGVTHARADRLADAEKPFQDALAQEPTFIPAHFDLGILYYRQNKNDPALQEFDLVQRMDPDRARVYYYQGLILRRMGKLKEAAAKMEKAAALDPEMAVEANHHAGSAYFEMGEMEPARKSFQNILTLLPEGEMAQSAGKFLEQINQREKDQKGWDLSLSTGLQYDDNVILKPTNAVPIHLQGVKEGSPVAFLFLLGRYQWLNTPGWIGQAEYSLYQDLHQDDLLDKFDLQSHTLLTNGGRRFGKAEMLLQYEARLMTIGGSRYLLQQDIGPRFIRREKGKRVTEFLYQFGSKAFDNITPFFPANTDRNVQTHKVGLNTNIVVRPRANLHVGYDFTRDKAGDLPAEDDWTFKGHRFSVGMAIFLRDSVVLTADTEYRVRRFDAKNERPPGDLRNDNEWLSIVALTRTITRNVDFTLQSLHLQNNSNIPLFEYKRNIYGARVTVRF